MRIIIDAMGGDRAPEEPVKGALEAQKALGLDIVLVGDREKIENCIKKAEEPVNENGIEIVHASQIVTMDDEPSTAVRIKKDSSMSVALRLLNDGQVDAMVSAGSTGALLTGATLMVKRIKGIRRAALAPVLPNGSKGVILIDCGANVECTEEYLLQFAFMGSFYAKKVLGYEKPRVGLLNVGLEESKGTELQKCCYRLLKKADDAGRINFIGNIEARDVFREETDVIVTDGFAGNILLKSIEGAITFIFSQLKEVLTKNAKTQIAAGLLKGDLMAMKTRFDAREIGGTALLGISKPVIKAHGSSDHIAIRGAIRQAVKFIESGVIDEITQNVDHMKVSPEDLKAESVNET